MKTNKKTKGTGERLLTHEGGDAKQISKEQQLRRSVLSCMLWEDSFYESGEYIGSRIASLIADVKPEKVANIAKEARNDQKLRHAPLLIAREMARLEDHKSYVKDVLENIIQRPDELSEFVSLYWKDKKQPLSNQVKKGLANAFGKFNEYQLSKWSKDSVIKLRDVMFLTHPKPKDKAQEELWKKLAENTLATPDTWEVNLSAGADKKETFERLMAEKKLGALAFLRNLRNMIGAGISERIMKDYMRELNTEKVLPFRFISAAKYAPSLEPQLEQLMIKCLEGSPKLPGKTALVVDISGSMFGAPVSGKSELDRFDAASALAILLREVCEDVDVYTFSNDAVLVPARRGFALREAMYNSQQHGGTNLGSSLAKVEKKKHDRIIVITDEQSHDAVPNPIAERAYMINVASYKNGVGYGAWTHIDGWSESIVSYISQYENLV